MTRKTITLARVLEAIGADTTPKITGRYQDKDSGAPKGKYPSCAIGGAAQVLGMSFVALHDTLDEIVFPKKVLPPPVRDYALAGPSDRTLGSIIVQLNDGTKLRKATVAKRLRAIVEKIDPTLLTKRLKVVGE